MRKKNIKASCEVNVAAHEVWAKWTTAEGLQSFFGKGNDIKLSIGGSYEIYYLMNNEVGYRGSEGSKILSYLPGKMISFSWTAPPQFREIRKKENKTWVVLLIDEITANKTQITLHHMGWPKDRTWDKVYRFYEHAWGFVLHGLKKSLAIS